MLVAGCSLRFIGLNWDAGQHLHPDERFLTLVIPNLGWPHSFFQYFDTETSPLNPLNQRDTNLYVYGQLPLIIVKAAAAISHRDNYDDILLLGRTISALFDAGSCLLVLLVGRKLLGWLLGLTAAVLFSYIPLHVQQAHFLVVDTFQTFFLLGSFLALCYWEPNGQATASRAAAFWAGAGWGAALACKISSALFALVVLLWLARFLSQPGRRRAALRQALLLFAVAFTVFRIGHPMAFAGKTSLFSMGGLFDIRPVYNHAHVEASPGLERLSDLHLVESLHRHTFWSGLREQAAISRGESEPPFNMQWVGRANYLYPLRNLALWAVGLPTFLPALAGLLMVLGKAIRKSAPPGFLIAALWCLAVFLNYGHWFSKFTRYYLIITPFLSLLAAYLLWECWTRARGGRLRCFAAGLTACVLAGAVSWGAGWATIYRRPNTRIAASQWLVAHLPPGTPVANETAWDDSLPLGGPQGLKMIDLALFDPDTAEKRDALLWKLDQAQWIVVSSSRAWASIPRLPQRWPLTTEYYRLLFSGRLGFAPVRKFDSYPCLLLPGRAIPIQDDSAEEALTVYDHPRVVLFAKTAAWSLPRARELLSERLIAPPNQKTLLELQAEGWHPDEAALPGLP